MWYPTFNFYAVGKTIFEANNLPFWFDVDLYDITPCGVGYVLISAR